MSLLPQMAILDGNAYDAKCLEAGAERDEDLESCALLLNNKGTALLQPGASASHSNQHKVIVQLQVRWLAGLCHHKPELLVFTVALARCMQTTVRVTSL